MRVLVIDDGLLKTRVLRANGTLDAAVVQDVPAKPEGAYATLTVVFKQITGVVGRNTDVTDQAKGRVKLSAGDTNARALRRGSQFRAANIRTSAQEFSRQTDGHF